MLHATRSFRRGIIFNEEFSGFGLFTLIFNACLLFVLDDKLKKPKSNASESSQNHCPD